MGKRLEKLGKLSLAILENFVEGKLGKKFIEELRKPTDRTIAVADALEQTEDRFVKEYTNKSVAKAIMLIDISTESAKALKRAIGKYFDHPTDPDFPYALRDILKKQKITSGSEISIAVEFYIELLTEELALADESFREDMRALADLRSLRILERVEQLLKKGAPGQITQELPALRQLPPPPTDFTGREKELTELLKKIQIGGVTISAIRGMGGIGKTALALKLAEQLAPQLPDAQIFLDLRGAHEQEPLTPAQIMAHVLHGFYPEAKLPENEAELAPLYCSTLQGKRALLFFDNAREAKQVEPLLPPPGCLTLVTSRQHFALPGLEALDLGALSPKDARLLIRRIVKSSKAGEADAIARQCGYLPLAIRVAAGILNTRPDWTPATLIKRLGDAQVRLGLVEGSLQLSYDLLDEAMQRCFRQLGVFPTSFTQEAATAVWGSDQQATDIALGALLAASLLEYDRRNGRYDLHDMARLLAEKRLDRNVAERGDAYLRHANYYCGILVIANKLYLEGGEKIMHSLRLFDLEWEHLKSGQKWSAGHCEEAERIARICNVYGGQASILGLRLLPRTDICWKENALQSARILNDKQAEEAHIGNLGLAYAALGETHKAIKLYEKALEIAYEIGDRRGEGSTLGNLGLAYAALGETRKAIEFYEKTLEVDREIGNRREEGNTLGNLGLAYADLGETRKAIEFYEKRMGIAREIGDRRGEGNALCNLGLAYAALGETRKAIEFYEKALEIDREIGDRRGEENVLGNLGTAYVALGETRKAIEFCENALIIGREIGNRRGEGSALASLGNMYRILGDKEQARLLWAQALSIYQAIEDPRAARVREWLEGLDK